MHATSFRMELSRDGVRTRLAATRQQRAQKGVVSRQAAAASHNGSLVASRPVSYNVRISFRKRSDIVRCQAIADDSAPPLDVEPVVVNTTEAPSSVQSDGASVVLGYFDAFNRRDMDAAIQFISPECVFEDLGMYSVGMKGTDPIRGFLDKWVDYPDDAVVVIDEIVEGDAEATGVVWHMEVAGKGMPLSRGASFYRLAPDGKLGFIRDLVEPFAKAGDIGLGVMDNLFPIIRELPPSIARAFVQPLPQEVPSTEGASFSLATQQVLDLYSALDKRDMATVDSILSPNVFYHDLGLYNEPFENYDALKAFFTAWADFPEDVSIVPDDFTTSGNGSCSIVWHVEVNGIPMPFSRGCSFYKVDESGKVVFGRDVVEFLIKTGDFTFPIMGAMMPVVRMLPFGKTSYGN